MKYTILLLSLFTFTSNLLLAEDQNKSCRPSLCHKPKKKKKSCAPTPISHPTTITKSGCYCLTRDIVGTIVIAADNVMLDLNCHLVDGNGAEFALSTSNQHDVSIKNGAVTNAGSLGISVINCEGAVLENIQIYNSNQAIVLSGCSTSSINAVRAYDNVNTSGAIILVDSSDSIRVTNVQANKNLKNLSVSVGPLDPGTAIVCVYNSINVGLQNCSVNSNSRINQNCRFSPLAIYFSADVQVRDCSVSWNYITEDDVRGFSPFIARASANVVVDGIQVSNNSLASTTIFSRQLYILDTPGTIIKNAQVNGNSCQLLNSNDPGFVTDFTGIFVSNANTGSNDVMISDCQISGNTVASAGDAGFEGSLVGVFVYAFSDFAGFEGRTTIENCQITDNIMTSTVVGKFLDGIILTGAADVTIDGVTCNGNSGGEVAIGIGIEGFTSPARNVTVRNSTANNNSGYDQAFGIFLAGLNFGDGLRTAAENCTLLNCVANGNTGASNGFGIVFADAIGCSAINCQTDANSRSGMYAGFVYSTDENPVNTDNSIINCSAKGNGLNGFEFSSTSTNDNFLVQDCVALANAGAGFLHTNDVLTSRFLGNYAKGNGTDYSIAGGAIQLFSLDINGTYTHVTGDPNHFSALVNIEGI